MKHVDVAVFGAGPAGCAAAITLARAGAQVILLERSTSTDGCRGEILPPQVCVPLRQLGIWERFCNDAHLSSPGLVSVWGDPIPHHNDFAFDPHGNGWQLDRTRFDQTLAEAAAAVGVTIRRGARVTPRRQARGGWHFAGTAADGHCISTRADFAIDATGRTAWLARRLGHRRRAHDRLIGFAATIASPTVARVLDRRMLIESCAHGWWYSAKISGDRYLAAFMTDAEQVAHTGARPLEIWGERMRSAPLTTERARPLRAALPTIRVATASTSRLSAIAGTDWAAVGDAATTVDPLSGRGVEHALHDGMAIALALSRGGDRHRALTGYTADTLRRFAEDRWLQDRHYRRETRWPAAPFWATRHRQQGNTTTTV
jgi:flavin-dependent dehydrogenase